MNQHKTFIKHYFNLIHEIIDKISVDDIDHIIDLLVDARRKGTNIYVMGCGGSASTASHFVADLNKTTIVKDKKRFKAHSLVDNTPLISAWTNDSSWEDVFKEQLINLLIPGDILIGISTSGGSILKSKSLNMVHAFNYAIKNGAIAIGLSGMDGGEFKKVCDTCLIVPSDNVPFIEGIHSDILHLIISRLIEIIKEGTN